MMDKEHLFYIFLALVAIVVIVFLNADKIWNSVDDHVLPLVDTGVDAPMTPGSGSADPVWIDRLDIDWGRGDVIIKYAPQDRISWVEVYTEGSPSRTNTMYYWMNTKTVFIHYSNQEYFEMDKKADNTISKDLHVMVPRGVVLDEIVVHHHSDGTITCDVEARKKEY